MDNVGVAVSVNLVSYMKLHGDDKARTVARVWERIDPISRSHVERAYGDVFIKWQLEMTRNKDE